MEMNQGDLRIGDYSGYIVKYEKSDDNAWIVSTNRAIKNEPSRPDESNENSIEVNEIATTPEPNLNSIQHSAITGNDILTESVYLSSLDGEYSSDESNRPCFTRKDSDENPVGSIVEIPSDILEDLNLGSIKKESLNFSCDCYEENREKRRNTRTQREASGIVESTKENEEDSPEGRRRRRSETKRRKKSRCVENFGKKFLIEEAARLSSRRVESKITEGKIHLEEARRKRLDDEAARKRDYRMYNETAKERRDRLDREAERRRTRRLKIYANESPDERRERLNRESRKRRESRMNQYARETNDERRERLQKDAMRAREMRFTRSAIESEDERRRRLIKDAVRKRELRMHADSKSLDRPTTTRNFTELRTIRKFDDESNDERREDNGEVDNSQEHFIGNWTMWFQNNVDRNNDHTDTSNENDNSRNDKIEF